MSTKRRNEKRAKENPTRPAAKGASAARARDPRYFWLIIPLSWVLILLALEGGLRLVGFGQSPALFLEVDSRTYVDNSDYTRRFYSLYDRTEPVQKSNYFPVEKQPGRLRVFVVGASTAQGFPFQRNHGFSGIAQAALRAVGVDVEVLNVGNSAMTSYYVREVLGDLVAYQPDFVAVYAGHNEYYGTPSMFTGGNHWTRLASLHLRRYRTVQALERALTGLASSRAPSTTLMERRFAEGLFPLDSVRDREVGELFIRNLDAGLAPLVRAGVATAVFEPVSNLIDMPPFRDAPAPGAAGGAGMASDTEAGGGSGAELEAGNLAGEYQRLHREFDGNDWNPAAWVSVKDRDPVPFRARSALIQMLQQYTSAAPAIDWIGTASELEKTIGPTAYSHALFIDHVHFNFDGQLLLGGMLARAVLDRFHPGDEARLRALEEYLSDPDRVRADIHLTAFWEFEAYTRIANLQTQEPFASMPVPKEAPAVPERVQRNSLFAGGDFIQFLQANEVDDLFFAAVDYYRAIGDRDEWIRNMNAYVHVYPGHYESHLAYAVALLEDDARANIDIAGTYVRRAHALSGGDPEVANVARQALVNAGLGAIWTSFQAEYLVDP